MTRRAWLVVLTLAVLIAGCSKKTTAPPPPPPTGSIAVSPGAAIVLVHDSRSLTATISNSAATAVTWRLVREPGLADTVDVGSIVSTGPLAATYNAPSRVISVGFDYSVTVVAVATTDTTLRGTATMFVPRVRITLSPASVASVPPGSWVPYRVKVDNAPNKGFELFVDQIAGGDAGVGTWVATTETTAVYKAPVRDTLFMYGLLARPLEDTDRFATSSVTVRAGFPLPTASANFSEFAPAWSPIDSRLAFVRGGAPWQLVVYDFQSGNEQVVTSFDWNGTGYSGSIDWSADGSRIAFSEQTGARRTIGLVNSNGTGRATLQPDPAIDYRVACFLPVANPVAESLYVVESTSAPLYSLRVYPALASSGDPGRPLLQGSTGEIFTSVDARAVSGDRPEVVLGRGDLAGLIGAVYEFVDDRAVPVRKTVTTMGGASALSVRWADFSDGFTWITYIWSTVGSFYRVQKSGLSPAQRCYVDFFPESSGDLKPDPPGSFHFPDAHAVARLEPDGRTKIWIIGAPPSMVVPVSRALEIELRRFGLWSAFQPRDWRVRRLTP